jgi:hypothetical protein
MHPAMVWGHRTRARRTIVEVLQRAHVVRAVPLEPGQSVVLEDGVRAGCDARNHRAMPRRLAKVARTARRGERLAQQATRAAETAAERGRGTVEVLGRAMTVADATMLATAANLTEARHRDGDGLLLRVLGPVLLLVDTAALIVVLGFLLDLNWAAPSVADLVTVVALATFGGAVQALLAVRLGRRLWARRHTDPDVEEFPRLTTFVVPLACLLGLLAGLAAAALLVRVEVEARLADAGPLGTALGLLLAGSALAAPWCVVAQEAFRPSPETQLARGCARAVGRIGRARARLVARARRRLDAAVRCAGRVETRCAQVQRRWRAEELATEQIVLLARGFDDPQIVYDRASADPAPPHLPELTAEIGRVHDAIRTARAALGVVAGAARDDHDLAG